jgi:hypothetical protein
MVQPLGQDKTGGTILGDDPTAKHSHKPIGPAAAQTLALHATDEEDPPHTSGIPSAFVSTQIFPAGQQNCPSSPVHVTAQADEDEEEDEIGIHVPA